MVRLARNSQRRALAMVEVAFVLPLVLLLVFGILEYGWLFLRAQQITHAARHGARIGVTADATMEDVNGAIGSILKRARIAANDEPWTLTPPDPAVMATGDAFTVTVTIPYERIGLGMPLVPVPGQLQASSTMAKEGP